MMQYSTYAVISPEGCASILWKSQTMAPDAAHALALTASRLLGFNLIDKIVDEPLGGAHRDYNLAANNLKRALTESYRVIANLSIDRLLENRYERLRNYGDFKDRG
jgi:acetyl-CoA carboxylase carboxyl transferase subunit alpha